MRATGELIVDCAQVEWREGGGRRTRYNGAKHHDLYPLVLLLARLKDRTCPFM